jgi:hypothetical protein
MTGGTTAAAPSPWRLRTFAAAEEPEKAGVAEYPTVFYYVGLLVNEPLGNAGLHFTLSRSLAVSPALIAGTDSLALPWVAVALSFLGIRYVIVHGLEAFFR